MSGGKNDHSVFRIVKKLWIVIVAYYCLFYNTEKSATLVQFTLVFGLETVREVSIEWN